MSPHCTDNRSVRGSLLGLWQAVNGPWGIGKGYLWESTGLAALILFSSPHCNNHAAHQPIAVGTLTDMIYSTVRLMPDPERCRAIMPSRTAFEQPQDNGVALLSWQRYKLMPSVSVCWETFGRIKYVKAHLMHCYINNTDVGLGWGCTVSLLYTTLRKPLWVLGPRFKCLFFWLTLHAPDPQQILLIVCARDLNVMQKSQKPVSLTKHLLYFFLFCEFCWTHWSPLIALQLVLEQSKWMQTTRSWFILASLFDILVKLDYNYVYQSPFVVVAGCYNEFNVVPHNGRHSCLKGYRHLPGKNNKNWGVLSWLLLLLVAVVLS